VRNGQTTGSLTVGPPSQGDFACPSGQSLFLQEVTYSGTNVSDATGNTFHATPEPHREPARSTSSSDRATEVIDWPS
jgi:hypothetical protein